MEIKSASYENGRLVLEVSPADGIRLCVGFQPGDYELKPVKKKRSLNANAYAWVLIDKLAAVLGLEKETVYRETVRQLGGVSEELCLENKALERFRAVWEAHGLGWPVEVISQNDKYTVVHAYYGSSTYDTEQMSRLINLLVQDCRELGIETLTPAELQRMGIEPCGYL